MSAELLGRYELINLIGEGAMGAVYRAYDPHLQRTVAIKVMSPALGNGTDAVARFNREAIALAALKHPHIVIIHDFLALPGNLCLVMELIEGEPLDEVIDQKRVIPVPQKLAFMASVCRALDYAHNHGIVHRDLKPSNILMLPDDSPKIVDFGIAKMTDEDRTRLTRTHTRIGTIAYMSPEQFNGEPVDHRSDIFSAGVVLYELLSGTSPFMSTNTTATMKKILIDPTPALPENLTDVPKSVRDALAKALAKEKGERYDTAAQLAQALETCMVPAASTRAETAHDKPVASASTRVHDAQPPVLRSPQPTPASVSTPHIQAPASVASSTTDEHPMLTAFKAAWFAILASALVGTAANYYLFSTEGGDLGILILVFTFYRASKEREEFDPHSPRQNGAMLCFVAVFPPLLMLGMLWALGGFVAMTVSGKFYSGRSLWLLDQLHYILQNGHPQRF